jgi:predicted flap endonuclease-1-like 5' DNA nuclease
LSRSRNAPHGTARRRGTGILASDQRRLKTGAGEGPLVGGTATVEVSLSERLGEEGQTKKVGRSKPLAVIASSRGKQMVENDLAELKGIGPKYAEMLKSVGVDSIKELRHRNPSHLKEMIESRHGKVVGLSEEECRTWIEEAKAHGA